jgi:hypothetical protein
VLFIAASSGACWIALAADAPGPPPASLPSEIVRVGHLACGGASFTLQGHYLDVPDHEFQTVAQRLTLERPKESTALVTLPHEGRPLRQPFLENVPVLDASITGWTCLGASTGKSYLYVVYTCAESPLRPDCVGPKREWDRLFDTKGRALNAGYPKSGSRTSALMKRLGLGRYAEGVQLQDIDD